MDWLIYGVKTAVVVSTKMAANNAVPGLGAAIDFTQAVYDLSQGDVVGASISTVSGVADLYSFGLFSSIKQAMTEGAKESTKEGAKVLAKKAGKETTKKFGHEVARQVAQGSFQGGKEAAIKYAPAMAREVRKKATKKFGERLGKDIARGLISESVEKVFEEGTKKAAGGALGDLSRKVISMGGNDVAKRILEGYCEDGIQLAISQALKQNPKLAFEFAKIAEEGASKEFGKHISKIIGKDFGVACVKGGIRRCSAK
ncbi:uncharacterized protein [Acropora muricata]|uniref:uncharacterized protein n=1 Tax=Acropora muricata TaxID=159855 RepID=UPI0034E382DB